MTVSRSRFLSNTAALGILTVLSTLFALLQVKILAAFLAPEVFGAYAALRGLSLLLAMLAANGLPQVLVRFLPVHEAAGARARAARLVLLALTSTAALIAVLAALVHAFPDTVFGRLAADAHARGFAPWFYATAAGLALKLVIYGGFNGLRRMSAQTWVESISLAVQVTWIFIARHHLDLTQLFMITGVVALAGVVVGTPWLAVRLRRDTATPSLAPAGAPRAAQGYGSYWLGATGLGLVALAFTDVDRWVLSRVLALELLSLFHIGSRLMQLVNRFLSVPVLSFQPEVTRLDSEGRADEVARSARVFFKFSVAAGVFSAAVLAAFAADLIRLVASDAYLGARPLLLLLAAAIPFKAMTAPLTAVMKALDQVRAALVCDLAWAVVYIAALLFLADRHGLIGAGWAQVAAAGVQLALAAVLGRIRPGWGAALAAVGRVLLAGAAAFALVAGVAALPLQGGVDVAARVLALVVGVWVFKWTLGAFGMFTADERERLIAMLARTPLGAAARRCVP